MKISKLLILLKATLLLTFTNTMLAQKLPVKERSLEPNHSIYSEIMEQEYQLYISFPSAYSLQDTITYPVLYVLDGKYMFSIIDGTRVNLDFENKIEEVIIVCLGLGKDLDSWQSNRTFAFTPSEDKRIVKYKSGGAETFLKSLKTEVIPFIDENYKTNADNAILGHSLGGLFVSYCLLKEPNLFNRYGISSPSLMWKDSELLSQAKKEYFTNKKHLEGKTIFLSVGGDEEELMISGMLTFASILKAKSNYKSMISWNIFNKETHLSVVSAMISRTLCVLYEKSVQ